VTFWLILFSSHSSQVILFSMEVPGAFSAAASKATNFWRLARQTPFDIVSQGQVKDLDCQRSLDHMLNNGVKMKMVDLRYESMGFTTWFPVRLFEPLTYGDEPPCAVIYCPSESASGVSGQEVLSIVKHLVPLGVAVLALSMSGSNRAILDTSTIAYAVKTLRTLAPVNFERIALWGRSAGAVTMLRCAASDPTIAALICDGAYTDLLEVLDPPEWLFSLRDITFGTLIDSPIALEQKDSPPEVASRCFVPALFIHGTDDEVVPINQAETLRKAYAGEKQFLLAQGGTHDSHRALPTLARALLFLVRAFRKEGHDASTQELIRLASTAHLADPSSLAPPDVEIRSLFQSDDPATRREGLLLAALAACPCHRGVRFEKVDLSLQEAETSEFLTTRTAGTVVLPELSSEIVAAFAIDSHIGKGRCGAVVFAGISPHLLTLSSVHICQQIQSSEGPSAERETIAIDDSVDRRGCLGGLQTRVDDLVTKLASFVPSSSPLRIKFEASCVEGYGNSAQAAVLVRLTVDSMTVEAILPSRDCSADALYGDLNNRVSFWRTICGGRLATGRDQHELLLSSAGAHLHLQYDGTATLVDKQHLSNARPLPRSSSPGLPQASCESFAPTAPHTLIAVAPPTLPESQAVNIEVADPVSTESSGCTDEIDESASGYIDSKFEPALAASNSSTGLSLSRDGRGGSYGTMLTKSSLVTRHAGSCSLTFSDSSACDSTLQERSRGGTSVDVESKTSEQNDIEQHTSLNKNLDILCRNTVNVDDMMFSIEPDSAGCSYTWPQAQESDRMAHQTLTLPAPGYF